MKLVLYSGGDDHLNEKIDNALFSLMKKKNPVVTYIPSSSIFAAHDFKMFVNQYKKYKIKKFLFFPIDIPFDNVMLDEVLKSDVIYLGGGNTFYFLHHIRKKKLINTLKNFAVKGGILCGLSAGAILMTENIETAGYPAFDRDENDIGQKNLCSLNLVNFFFFPHFKNSSRYDKAFRHFSLTRNKMVVCCPDGSGVVISGNELRFLGKQYIFHRGHKIVLNSY